MNIYYRTPTKDDIEMMSAQLTASYQAAYRGLMTEEYLSSLAPNHWVPILETSMQRGDSCLVAEVDGDIVGSSIFGVAELEGATYAQWHAFYLLPQVIGQGIGHAFLEETEAEMKKKGCRFCLLEVLSTNVHAIKFYRSHGFVNAGIFMVEENGMRLSCDKMIKEF